MFKRFVLVCLVLCFSCAPVAALAAPLETTLPFDVEAESALLLEAETGQVIFEKNADAPRPVASITKLMTILLVLEAVDEGRAALTDSVTASQNAAGMGGSQVLLDAGGVYALGDLLKSLIVASANDASVALAEHLLGSEAAFVEAMNRRAVALGLRDTVYRNSSGLPAEGQHTTARDVAVLSAEVLKHPRFFQYSSIWMDELTHNSGRVTQLVNTNRLIRFYQGADGVKTGSTNEAGYCVSASAQRGDLRFIAVVLGSPTGKKRFDTAQALLNHGFDHYAFITLQATDTLVAEGLEVEGAKGNTLALRLAFPARVLCRRGEEGLFSMETSWPDTLRAPIEAGSALGEAVVRRGDAVVLRVPLVAAHAVDKKGFGVNLRLVWRLWLLCPRP